ncbi:MAG: glutamine synthetase family protein [Salinisphaera sp.]|jgi:glutamine synthetase|nr:glutamine synthetase family protein [Salinisphaera sp.]
MATTSGDSRQDFPAEVQRFWHDAPNAQFIDAFIVDINGIARGKRLPISALARLYDNGICLPASTALLDIRGEEVEATGLAMETGDADHSCYPVPGSLRLIPWSTRPGGQLLLHMCTPSGTPFVGDPRTALGGALDKLRARGLTPVVATELEFRLFDADMDKRGRPRAARQSSAPGRRSQLYGLDELDRLDTLFADIEAACLAQNLPMDTLIAEQSEGQYEINLEHVPDALLAADYAVLLKRTVKACARRHGLAASFMAKPSDDSSGNGMHAHVSLLDSAGENVFTQDGQPSTQLLQAVAGLLDTMADATALFAPHANSYRRFQPGSHAPMASTWGSDNRTTALRIPLSAPAATRIEHRVAGADANPYLVLAAILGGIEHGLANELSPPPEIRGNAHGQRAPALPDAWGVALERFERSPFIADCLGADYQAWFTACKRQERDRLSRIVPASEYDLYLQTV